MKHFQPWFHGTKSAVRNVKTKSLGFRAPKHIPWKMLAALVKDYGQDLTADDLKKVSLAVRHRDLNRLSEIESEWSPQCMASVDVSLEEFTAKYQLSAALKKYPFPGSEEDCKANAIAKFFLAEDLCKRFNKKGYKVMERMNEIDPHLAGFIEIAQSFIINVVGSSPNLPEVLLNGRHGPGASLCTTKGRVTPYYKVSDLPYSVTPSARQLAISTIESDPRWIGALNDWYREKHNIAKHLPISRAKLFDEVLEERSGNRVTFVPKTRLTHRTIAIEPRLNLYLQLGVDHLIRTKLKRFGCDLDSQVKNQVLALYGSKDNSYSTLDLSMASDTVSLKIIELLFPPLWVNLLLDLRSPTGEIGSTQNVSYEKLSSMGNGFTFAIESLIFLALVHAATVCYNRRAENRRYSLHDDVAVFGDDIVVPTPIAHDVETLLYWSGFRINREKSFTNGPFRESCGKDYFSGTLVRPLQFKKEVKDVIEVFSIHNRAMFWDYQRSAEYLPEKRYEALKKLAYSWIPTDWRAVTGPPSTTEFDTYIHTPVSFAGASYTNSLFAHWRLVEVARSNFKADKFFFRRLMALNRPTEQVELIDVSTLVTRSASQKGKMDFSKLVPTLENVLGSGNVYQVTQRNCTSYKLIENRTSSWFDSYYPMRH